MASGLQNQNQPQQQPSTIIWTVLPNGIARDSAGKPSDILRVSVLITPQIHHGGPIAKESPFYDWPSTLKKILQSTPGLKIRFQDGAMVDASYAFPIENLDSGLWNRLFISSQCEITPFSVPDTSNVQVNSFSQREVATVIKDLQLSVATKSPLRPATIADIVDANPTIILPFLQVRSLESPILKQLGSVQDQKVDAENKKTANQPTTVNQPISSPLISKMQTVMNAHPEIFSIREKRAEEKRIIAGIGDKIAAAKVVTAAEVEQISNGSKLGHLVSAKQFYDGQKTDHSASSPEKAPSSTMSSSFNWENPDKNKIENFFDFHNALALLAQYPEIMRKLGLIIDLSISASKVPMSLGDRQQGSTASPTAASSQSATTVLPSIQLFSEIFANSDQSKTVFGELFLNLTPRTFYVYDGRQFMARPNNDTAAGTTPITNGMLHFHEPQSYIIVSYDTDGPGLATLDAINNMILDDLADDEGSSSPPPSATTTTATSSSSSPQAPNIDAAEMQEWSNEAMNVFADRDAEQSKRMVMQATAVNVRKPLPPLRSVGISIAQSDRAKSYIGRIKKDLQSIATSSNTSSNEGFYLQDLTRGYRIDVWDDHSKKWHSLNKRIGKYVLGDHEQISQALQMTFEDEGWIQPAATQPKPATGSTNLPKDSASTAISSIFLHESLFGWRGWSLSAPRPGQPIDPSDTNKPIKNDPLTKFKFSAGFLPKPMSLPRLRFGRGYRFRARVVDLVGNGLSLENSDDAFATKDVFYYYRYEPITSPVLILKNELKHPQNAGESLANIVIHTYNNTPEGDAKRSDETGERHVAPPRISQFLAETHGMFDAPSANNLHDIHKNNLMSDKDMYTQIAQRDKASLEVFPPSLPKVEPGSDLAKNSSAAGTKQGQFPIDRNDQAKIPYLPDPFSRGTTIYNLPGATLTPTAAATTTTAVNADAGASPSAAVAAAPKTPSEINPSGSSVSSSLPTDDFLLCEVDSGSQQNPNESAALKYRSSNVSVPKAVDLLSITKVPFGNKQDWPDILPFRIKILEPASINDTLPEWSPKDRVLTVKLPKAEIATIKLSNYFESDSDLIQMGIWRWIIESNPDHTRLKQYALHGLHHMITPYTKVQLVHAVQKPLSVPEIQSMKMSDQKPKAQLVALVARSAPLLDSAKAQLVARSAPLLDSAKASDIQQPQDAQLLEKLVVSEYRAPSRSTSAFLDAKLKLHKKSTEKIALTAKWQQCMDDGVSPNPGADPTQFRDLVSENFIPYESGDIIDFSWQHKFADTKHRMVQYIITATSRFKEYFKIKDNVPLKEGDFSRESTPFELNILNRAIPAKPKVAYVIPTFRWEKERKPENQTTLSVAGNTTISRRIGGGFRVYLERPWFSSGCGELLGVIMLGRDQILDPLDDNSKRFTTVWGMDPILGSDNVTNPTPSIEDFMNVATIKGEGNSDVPAIASNMRLAELADEKEAEKLKAQKFWQIGFNVIGHSVNFDKDRNLWFSDISINTQNYYSPFIRFGLVRYQPSSVENAHISQVVLSDIVKLLPNREAEIIRLENMPDGTEQYQLTIRGSTYKEKSVNAGTDDRTTRITQTVDLAQIKTSNVAKATESIDQKVVAPDSPHFLKNIASVAAAAGAAAPNAVSPPTPAATNVMPDFSSLAKKGTEFEIAVEKMDDASLGEELGWSIYPDAKIQIDSSGSSTTADTLWKGTITMQRKGTGEKYRVLIREYEMFYSDNQDYVNGHFDMVRKSANSEFLEVGRLSYLDTVEV